MEHRGQEGACSKITPEGQIPALLLERSLDFILISGSSYWRSLAR